ncbi:LuxR C-terminal-related transcriptional regulator [Actinoplanes sp. DH11]|uniref:LuxR C-terminal-related transcriptional regulator n=1 Tax=Actinoplanes sp. DH11 TaxID=2857011 RepID=UPI001E39238D|nr:LuxR C-terminal-related transcriptional regulator [Actinoplanes sp. DH11]
MADEPEVAARNALRHGPALVVLAGPPGCGRSTLLRKIAASVPGPAYLGGGLAMLAGVPALALSRAVRARLPADDVHLLAEAVRSRVRGGLLVLDDLHHVDPATLAALPHIARHCRVLVAVRTPHRLPADALRAAATAWLPVPPLGTAAATALARSTAAGLDDAALAAVLARAGGNPLAITALARQAAAGRAPVGEDIDQVAYAIAAALADLPRPARTALAALGLLGRPARAELLGTGAADLLAAGLVTAEAGGSLVPVSAYVAETAAGLLDAPARTDLHTRLADLTPPAESARHLAAAGDTDGAYRRALSAADRATGGERAELLLFACGLGTTTDPRVRLAAADAALATGRPLDAAAVLRPLALTPPTATTLALEAAVLRGEALLQAGETAAARDAVRQIPDTAAVPVVAARDRVLLLTALTLEPMAALDLADKIAVRHPDPLPGIAAALAAVRATHRLPGWEQALSAAAFGTVTTTGRPPGPASRPGLNAPAAAPGGPGFASGTSSMSGPAELAGTPVAAASGSAARGSASGDSATGATGPGGDPLITRWSAWLLVEHLAADGRLVESAHAASHAAAAAGAALAYGWQTRFLAAADWALALHGHHLGLPPTAPPGAGPPAAPDTAFGALTVPPASSPDAVLPAGPAGPADEFGSGDRLAPEPDWDGAEGVLRRAANLTDLAIPADALGYATAATALIEADTGLLAAARARLGRAAAHPAAGWVAREAAWLDGQPDRAVPPPAAGVTGLLAGLHAVTGWWAAHDLGVPGPVEIPVNLPGPARRTLTAWALGTGFAAAADAWRPVALREQIRCLLAAGLTEPDRDRAVAALLRAEQLADQAGLTVLAGRARRGLRRHQIHRDTRSRRSHGRLTQREIDVLRLVAAGEPTRRIAGQLGISAETVDTHIRASMRKLGARTRTEAAALAFTAPPARSAPFDDSEDGR